jgi:hypothetical protein
MDRWSVGVSEVSLNIGDVKYMMFLLALRMDDISITMDDRSSTMRDSRHAVRKTVYNVHYVSFTMRVT